MIILFALFLCFNEIYANDGRGSDWCPTSCIFYFDGCKSCMCNEGKITQCEIKTCAEDELKSGQCMRAYSSYYCDDNKHCCPEDSVCVEPIEGLLFNRKICHDKTGDLVKAILCPDTRTDCTEFKRKAECYKDQCRWNKGKCLPKKVDKEDIKDKDENPNEEIKSGEENGNQFGDNNSNEPNEDNGNDPNKDDYQPKDNNGGDKLVVDDSKGSEGEDSPDDEITKCNVTDRQSCPKGICKWNGETCSINHKQNGKAGVGDGEDEKEGEVDDTCITHNIDFNSAYWKKKVDACSSYENRSDCNKGVEGCKWRSGAEKCVAKEWLPDTNEGVDSEDECCKYTTRLKCPNDFACYWNGANCITRQAVNSVTYKELLAMCKENETDQAKCKLFCGGKFKKGKCKNVYKKPKKVKCKKIKDSEICEGIGCKARIVDEKSICTGLPWRD